MATPTERRPTLVVPRRNAGSLACVQRIGILRDSRDFDLGASGGS